MKFFRYFPKTGYDFFDKNQLSQIPDFFRKIKMINSRFVNLSAYEFYTITEERPDQLSQIIYGTTEHYWTFFITNEHLIDGMNGWPMNATTFNNKLAEYENWYTINPWRTIGNPTDYNSIGGLFSIGTSITGATSGATGKIIARNASINQIVFKLDEGSSQFLSNERINGLTSIDVFNNQHQILPYLESPYQYLNSDGEVIINNDNFLITDPTLIKTHKENIEETNDSNGVIRVIRKEFINDFVQEFRRLINE